MDGRKILLVEDHEDSRRAMKRLLEIAGFHVVEAGTVAEGIAQVDGQAFALLDLNLPDGEGTAVCHKFRVHAPHTRVAFVTAINRPEEELQRRGTRPDAIFKKPIDMIALMGWLKGSEG